MQSNSRLYMLSFMAQLLHPSAAVDKTYFTAPEPFWERLVQIGSGHLVLPAIYGALKRKKLVNYAPKDLVSYLRRITDLNRKRNTAILKQIDFLTEVFRMHEIDYVFIKGAALLITKPYKTINERMVGDIDILIVEKDLLRAQQLLIDKGFAAVPTNKFIFTKGVFSDDYYKHLERISHPNYIAAVEIHRRILIKENYLMPTKDILRNKLQSKQGQWIPSNQHQWQHAILNWQYNDNGMTLNHLSFRVVVDVLFLETKDMTMNSKTSPRAIKHFYSLLSLYYGKYKTYYPQKKLIYKWKLQSRVFDKSYSFFKNFTGFIFIGFLITGFFLSSKNYRKRVLQNPKIFLQRIFEFWNK